MADELLFELRVHEVGDLAKPHTDHLIRRVTPEARRHTREKSVVPLRAQHMKRVAQMRAQLERELVWHSLVLDEKVELVERLAVLDARRVERGDDAARGADDVSPARARFDIGVNIYNGLVCVCALLSSPHR